jgi:hypothetical protein
MTQKAHRRDGTAEGQKAEPQISQIDADGQPQAEGSADTLVRLFSGPGFGTTNGTNRTKGNG